MVQITDRQFTLALVSLWFLLIGGARAAEMRVPTQTETLAMLNANQFADLDSRFGAVQSAYKTRAISDEDLRAAFRVFYVADPALEKQYLGWLTHSPTSYVAHLATGIFYKKIGQDRRGNGYISELSDDNIAGMQAAFVKANEQLNASLALDDKPLLTYLHLINITQYLGDHAASRRLYDESVKLDPANFIMRQNYMNTLQTQWGGSVDAMQYFLKECQHAGLSSEHYKLLESVVIEDQAWNHENVDGNLDAARKEYEEASKLDRASICLPCGPLGRAAQLALEIHNFEDAIKQFSKILAVDPGALRPRAGRGFAELQLGKIKPAVTDIQYAADHGDAYAQDLLGKMYLLGTSIPQDRDKAIEWIKKASDQGYPPAVSLLPLALNRNAKPLPVPGDLKM